MLVHLLSSPDATPVDHFIETILPKYFGVEFDVGPLPQPSEAITLPGGGTKPTWIIMSEEVFDAMKAGDGRARFTAAHECYHALVHAKEFQSALVNGTFRGMHRPRDAIPAYSNPERQADVFASRFLMPEPALRLAVQSLGSNVRELADLFQVSASAMNLRLGEIELR